MEPQTRHGKEPWRRQCGDESRRLRFHLQPLRMYLFPTLFFSWSSLRSTSSVGRGVTGAALCPFCCVNSPIDFVC